MSGRWLMSAAGLATLVATLAIAPARAMSPDAAPAESRAQIGAAVAALEPWLASPSRGLARGAEGTLERAILAYAPARAWPVAEGALAAPHGARCPAEMASVGGRFCVDRYEGSLLVSGASGALEPWPANQPLAEGRVYTARSVAGVTPQGYVSAAQADVACRHAGKRLCHPVEWRAACGGSRATAYPYGPLRRQGVCKDSGAAPMMLLHADTARRGWGMAELNDPENLAVAGGVALTGAHAGCVSDLGVYDMVGNLHEWTADPNGTFQGGYWLDTREHGEGCAYRTIAHGFGYHDYSTGFRCCKDG